MIFLPVWLPRDKLLFTAFFYLPCLCTHFPDEPQTINVNQTTITTIDEHSAFGFTSIYDDNGDISAENIFTNTLNVLGWIPIVSIISGFARAIFADYKLDRTPSSDLESRTHYENHLRRGLSSEVLKGSIYFGIGNVINFIWDIRNAFLTLDNWLKKHPTPLPDNIHQL